MIVGKTENVRLTSFFTMPNADRENEDFQEFGEMIVGKPEHRRLASFFMMPNAVWPRFLRCQKPIAKMKIFKSLKQCSSVKPKICI